MKKSQWLPLVTLNLLVIVCILLPFLPGRYDKLAFLLSAIAQVTGIIGLLLVPFGLLWLIREIQNKSGNNPFLTNWTSGYYYAIITTCICTFICLFFTLALLMEIGSSAAIAALTAIIYILHKCIPAIRRLKNNSGKVFNAAPLYFLSIPLIAFTARMLFIEPASNYSRDYAIKHGEQAITAIENYHAQYGSYPESIEYVYGIPKPSVIGIGEFIYERNGNAYNLSFVQWQHFGATREVVMFNRKNQHNVKGHFASFDASKQHWRYYWLD